MATKIVHKTTLEIVTEDQFRRLHDNTMFPKTLTDENIADTDFVLVPVPLEPVVPNYKNLELNKPILVNGQIRLIWNAVDKPLSDATRSEMVQQLREIFDKYLNQLTTSYPSSEIDSWSKQELEARNYLLDNESPTPLINALALNRGIPKYLLVEKIISKSDAYAQYVGKLIGTRQKLEDQIYAATKVEELPEIPTSINFE